MTTFLTALAADTGLTAAADNSDELEWPVVVMGLGFGMGLLILVTVLIVVVLREVGASRRARAEIAREEEYKKLAERYDTFASATAASQERHATDVAEVRRRLTEIETLLRSVE